MVSVYTILWQLHIFALIFVDDAPNVLLHVCNIADTHMYMHMYLEGTHFLWLDYVTLCSQILAKSTKLERLRTTHSNIYSGFRCVINWSIDMTQ